MITTGLEALLPPTLAAASGSGAALGLLLAVVAVAVVVYLVSSAVWPHTNCSRCDGAGKFRSPNGRAWRDCPRCGGRGSRTRLGTRVWARYSDERDRGR